MSKQFGSARAVDDVSFDIRSGEILGLLGPNGAGKTTTMRMITGYLRPTAGSITVGGIDMVRDPVRGRALLGYMPESSALYPEMTVQSYLHYFAKLRNVARPQRKDTVARVIRQAGLGPVVEQRVGFLSKGFRQRVALAQALVADPPVVILDEPTAGLDPRQVVETREVIARLGRSRTVLLSSHLLAEVTQLCRRVAILDRGRLVAVEEVATLTALAGVTRLELRVAGDRSRAAAVVRGVEGVEGVDIKADVIVVRGAAPDLNERVAAAVVGAGLSLVELRVTGRGSLEEAYLRLVES